MYKITQETLA